MPLDPTPVRRCVCSDLTFFEMKESGCESLNELQKIYGVCNGCQTCLPYIEKMLETGETAFAVEPLPLKPWE
jgi:bacterioferritin-associated ferredoxin